jgi:hypothetical protein
VALPLANPNLKQTVDFRRPAIRLSVLSRSLVLWHLASFDAPTVAVVWAFAFAQAAGVPLQAWIAVLLFCGTWTVYVGDRLLDARRAMLSGRLNTLRERHFFHWRHRRTLLPFAVGTGAMAAFLIVHRMPVAVRERNSLLAAAALAYFSGVHSSPPIPAWLRRIATKELLVGVLFTAGCAAPVLARSGRMPVLWTLLAFFAALAWCNCRAIERWESSESKSNISLHAGLLGATGTMMGAGLGFKHPGAAALLAAGAVSSLLLLILDRVRYRISPLMLRTLADVALLAPAVLIAWGGHTA